MKNIKWLSGVFIMVLGLSVFSACSEDDDKAKPIFPEKQSVDCSVGEEKTLTFNAEHSWTLSSSRLWCKFKDGKDAVSSLSGGVGQQTVTITVTEDVWNFEDAIAEITMGMEAQTQVVAVVNRAAKKYEIESYLKSGDDKVIYNNENPVVLPYSSLKYTEVNIAANFDWKVVNCPAWVMVEEQDLLGEAGKTVTWELQFQSTNDISKVDEQTGFLEFVDANGASRLKIPVKYNGMPEDEIEFTRPEKDYWDWYFSADATKCWKSNSMNPGTGSKQYDLPLIFTATTKGESTIVRFDVNKWGYTPREGYYPSTDWFNATKQGQYGAVITVDPNTGTERKGCVMVIPNKVLDGLSDGIYGLTYEDEFSGSLIKPEYEKYIAFDFTQEGVQGARGFDIEDMELGSLNEKLMDMSSELGGKYGTSTVYMLTLDGMTEYSSITVTPKGYSNPTCTVEGANLWSDVGYEPNWGKKNFSIWGISKGEKDSEMIFTIMDGETVYSVLIVNQY